MESTKPLKPVQLTAIQLLAIGTPASHVAQQLEVSAMTIYRWQRQPEFEAKLQALTSSGLVEIAKTMNATTLTAVETLQDILCDLSQPTATRLKAALGVLGVMASVNGALEKGLQHRVADFDLKQRWNNLGHTYDAAGHSGHEESVHTV